MDKLTHDERLLLSVAASAYRATIRQACREDQDDPDGEPGTLGRDIQERLAVVLEKLRIKG